MKIASILLLTGALILPNAASGQEKSYRTEYTFADNIVTIGYTDKFNCDLPLYFSLERNLESRYAGRVFKHRGGVVVQISDAGSPEKKNEFMGLEHNKQNESFDNLAPLEEYTTSLPPKFGASYNDGFKKFQGGEWSRVAGEKLSPETVQYFNRLFNGQILPRLEECKQPKIQ